MNKAKNILVTITIALACFAAFITIFESGIVIPAWLQVAGRFHPLMVHFPIVLFLLFIVYKIFLKKHIPDPDLAGVIDEWLLMLSALSAVVSVIMGVLLSKEPGYDADAIAWHKWSGIMMAAFMLLWYALRNATLNSRILNAAFCTVGFFGIVFASHQGAGITHGNDYLFEPVKKDIPQPLVSLEDAVVFNDMVQPILQAKCMSCHNSKKAKGQLVMETKDLLMKGGKSGSLWDKNDADLGLLLRRIHLPLEQRKHMPPAGKAQLTDYEIAVLTAWIKKGHDFALKVADLPATDSLHMLAAEVFSSSTREVYDFAAADDKKIQALNTENCMVQPVAMGSPALAVDFYGASLYRSEQLKKLLDVKQQIVSLNLNKIPATNEDLKTVGQLKNLRRLNLDFTNITGAGLNQLKDLTELKQLSLSGVQLKASDLAIISSLPALKHLYLWNTGLGNSDLPALQNEHKLVKIESGFVADTIRLQLTPPILENEEQIITTTLPLKLKHYIKGVAIRYTLDGTEPDSISSPLYNKEVVLNKNASLKAKAYKQGWIASELLEASFFKSTYRADSASLLLPPDASRKGNGAVTLNDAVKGGIDFRNDKWLGYHLNDMSVLLVYNTPVNVSSVTLSSLVDIGSYIMPASFVEVWGGPDKNHLKLLGKIIPQQPLKIVPAYLKGFEVTFKPASVNVIKVVAGHVAKLPAWHPGKGEKGWLFADEIFVN